MTNEVVEAIASGQLQLYLVPFALLVVLMIIRNIFS